MHPFTSAAAGFVSLIVAWSAAAAEPLVLEIWPGKVPDESGDIGAERFRMSPALDRKQVEVTEPTRMITDVAKPTITIYRPAKEKDTGTAMLICPGGGYWNLYWQLEGEEVAAWLNSLGVTGIILKYRVPRRPAANPGAGRQPGPQQGQGLGHRSDANRHDRFLGGRPSDRGDCHELRPTHLRAARRHGPGKLPAGLRDPGLSRLSGGEGVGGPRALHPNPG